MTSCVSRFHACHIKKSNYKQLLDEVEHIMNYQKQGQVLLCAPFPSPFPTNWKIRPPLLHLDIITKELIENLFHILRNAVTELFQNDMHSSYYSCLHGMSTFHLDLLLQVQWFEQPEMLAHLHWRHISVRALHRFSAATSLLSFWILMNQALGCQVYLNKRAFVFPVRLMLALVVPTSAAEEWSTNILNSV